MYRSIALIIVSVLTWSGLSSVTSAQGVPAAILPFQMRTVGSDSTKRIESKPTVEPIQTSQTHEKRAVIKEDLKGSATTTNLTITTESRFVEASQSKDRDAEI